MDDTIYKRWWALHYRVACGEHLSPEDQLFYERGESDLDKEEALLTSKGRLGQERLRTAELKNEYERLKDQAKRLEAEILCNPAKG
jgi:molecular chaperone GrpE (heat shock protein)